MRLPITVNGKLFYMDYDLWEKEKKWRKEREKCFPPKKINQEPFFVILEKPWDESSIIENESISIRLNSRQREYVNQCLMSPVLDAECEIDLDKLIELR